MLLITMLVSDDKPSEGLQIDRGDQGQSAHHTARAG